MSEHVRPWTAEESLTDLTLYLDWDYMASMVSSLRIYLFNHGSIPIWNYPICGGRPEISIPASWTYTWPSLFAYLFPPNQALIALWVVMTLVGFFSMRALLMRWGGTRLGAGVGAAVYVFSGYFSARFNYGQATFAFMHLVPLMMLTFDRAFQVEWTGSGRIAPLVQTTVISFLFFTAGLPHALFNFYPAFLMLAIFLVVSRALGGHALRALNAMAAPVIAHLLGLWLAAYKLWPVMAWQAYLPRKGVLEESYSLLHVLRGTIHMVYGFLDVTAKEAWQVYPSVHQDTFVGPAAWLLAMVGVWGFLRTRNKAEETDSAGQRKGTLWYALALLAAGLTLSLGKDHPLSLQYYLRGLPFVEGIRVASRYQILTIFSLSILVSSGFAALQRTLQGRAARSLLTLLSIATLGPVALQTGILIWNIEAIPDAEILRSYDTVPDPKPPVLIGGPPVWGIPGHTKALLERGYWVANCWEDISFPTAPLSLPFTSKRELSSPPPIGIGRLTPTTLLLIYSEEGPSRIFPELPLYPLHRYDATARTSPDGRTFFGRSQISNRRLAITAEVPGVRKGFRMSLAGLLVSSLLFAFHVRWRRRTPPPAG